MKKWLLRVFLAMIVFALLFAGIIYYQVKDFWFFDSLKPGEKKKLAQKVFRFRFPKGLFVEFAGHFGKMKRVILVNNELKTRIRMENCTPPNSGQQFLTYFSKPGRVSTDKIMAQLSSLAERDRLPGQLIEFIQDYKSMTVNEGKTLKNGVLFCRLTGVTDEGQRHRLLFGVLPGEIIQKSAVLICRYQKKEMLESLFLLFESFKI